MAAPTKAARPGRTVAAFLVVLLALGGLMVLVDRTPTPRLGLDLRGGTSITLTAETTEGTEVTAESLATAVNIIRSRVDGSGVAEAEITTQGNNTIVVAVPGVEQDELVELVGTTAELRFRQVLNIAPGTPAPTPAVTPTPTPTGSATTDPSASPTGTASPGETTTVPPTTPATTPPATTTPPPPPPPTTTSPAPRVVSPGDDEAPNALGLFGARGARLQPASTVLAAATTPAAPTTPADTPAPTTPAPTGSATTPTPTGSPTPTPSGTPDPAAEAIALQQAFAELDCSDPASLQGGNTDSPDEPIVACEADGTFKYVLAAATVLGTDVADAAAALPQTGIGNWIVTLDFTSEGASKFTAMSERLVSAPAPTNQFGIVLDGVVQSAPVMNERIPGGSAQITGEFTQVEAQQLANVLKYGALPLAFETSSVDEVTPTLGSVSLQAGLIAGSIGLALVLVYALFYYRALGLVIVASLVVAAAMTYVAVVLLSAWIGFTLTLAGVAGLIVAIGITADSFIIYFERIRDEVREGRTLRASIEHGWVRARRTIIAADVVSLLSATVLYIVSIGNVRGFAFALGLSTVIDIVMVFLFTKPLMSWLGGTRFFGEGSRWSGLSGDRLGAPVRRRGTVTPKTTGLARTAEES